MRPSSKPYIVRGKVMNICEVPCQKISFHNTDQHFTATYEFNLDNEDGFRTAKQPIWRLQRPRDSSHGGAFTSGSCWQSDWCLARLLKALTTKHPFCSLIGLRIRILCFIGYSVYIRNRDKPVLLSDWSTNISCISLVNVWNEAHPRVFMLGNGTMSAWSVIFFSSYTMVQL